MFEVSSKQVSKVTNFSEEKQSVEIKGKDVSVPDGCEDYFEDGAFDSVRRNKSKRQQWAELFTQGIDAFNELASYNLFERDINEYLKGLNTLIQNMEHQLDAIQTRINTRYGRNGGTGEVTTDLDYTATVTISMQNLSALVKGELQEYSRLNTLRKALVRKYNSISTNATEKARVANLLKTDGHISDRDDAYQDSAVFDYGTHPTYTHPCSHDFVGISTEALAFGATTIYSASDEAGGQGLESVLETLTEFVDDQWHTVATAQTRRFATEFRSLLAFKSEQIRKVKGGLAQAAFERLNRDLVDTDTMPVKTFKILADFCKRNGAFTTYVLDRDIDLDHAVDFVEEKLKAVKKPWFSVFRKSASKKYLEKTIFLQTTLNELRSHQLDTQGFIDQAKKGVQGDRRLQNLLNDFNEQRNTGINAPAEISLDGLTKNLDGFIEFIDAKAKEKQAELKAKKWYQKWMTSRSQVKALKAELKFIQEFKEAAVVTRDDPDSLGRRKKIKFVVDSDLSKDILTELNKQRKDDGFSVLQTGFAKQLMEKRIYHRSEKDIKQERTAIAGDELFREMLEDYNTFRDNLGRASVGTDGVNAYEQILKNADFSEFVEAKRVGDQAVYEVLPQEERRAIEERAQQMDEFLARIKVNLGSVQDRFLDLLKKYNEFRQSAEPEKDPIQIDSIFAVPVNDQAERDDRITREKAFIQLKENADFGEFIVWHQQQLNQKDIKDISGKTREFCHYLRCVQRELDNPMRNLAARLEERTQDTYDRFSDLVVYHGVNEFNIKQATRYLNIMTAVIKNWAEKGAVGHAPIKIPGVDLTNEDERTCLLLGFEIAAKIINGKSTEDYLDDGHEFLPEIKAALALTLPREKFQDTGYAAVERMLVSRYSRVHLSKHFLHSKSTQVQLNEGTAIVGEEEKATPSQLVDVISKNTVLDVKAQYLEVGSDALSFFHHLFFMRGTPQEPQDPRVTLPRIIPVKDGVADNFDNFEKYFKTNTGANISEAELDKLKHSLSITSQAGIKESKEVCRLGDAFYQLTLQNITHLLARLNFNENYRSQLRYVVDQYLHALEEEEVSLEVLKAYAQVFSILFTEEELQRVANVIFAQVFEPSIPRLTLSKEIKDFIIQNKLYIDSELQNLMQAYIAEQINNQFDYHNMEVFFEFGNLENQRLYATKKLQELLTEACGNAGGDRFSLEVYEKIDDFNNYIQSKNQKHNFKFSFDQANLGGVFAAYTATAVEDEDCFWRQGIDQLACIFYTSNAGAEFVTQGRLAQIELFLTREDTRLDSINVFAKYIKTISEQTQRSIELSQESVNSIFSKFFKDIFPKIKGQAEKLHVLNNAERLALFFDGKGEWLDYIRLVKIEGILDGTLPLIADDFLSEIMNTTPYRPYPATDLGREDFEFGLRSRLIDDSKTKVLERYDHTVILEPLLKITMAFGKDLLLDQMRLAQMLQAYRNPVNVNIHEVISNIFRDPESNEVRFSDNVARFPLTPEAQNELEQFFQEVIIIKDDGPVKGRYHYNAVVETMALQFDTQRQFLDSIRIARISEILQASDLTAADHYIAFIKSSNEDSTIESPLNEQKSAELQTLFLEFIYPNSREDNNIISRYGYSVAMETMIFNFGNSDNQQKCIVARVAEMFKATGATSEPELVMAYIERFKSDERDSVINSLTDENLSELNRVLNYYVNSSSPWSANTQKLIEAIEPNRNKKRFLKVYRLKRLVEVLKGEGCEFTQEEYRQYQEMRADSDTASINNLNRFFGASQNTQAQLKTLFIGYINDLLSNRDDMSNYELTLLKQSDVFNLAIVLFNEAVFDNETVQVEGCEFFGQTYCEVWTSLMREFHSLDRVKKRVDEVTSCLTNDAYHRAKVKYEDVVRHGQNTAENSRAEYKRATQGIVVAATEFVKEQVAYLDQLGELQIAIQKVVEELFRAEDIVVIRQQVKQLINLFAEQVPDIASDKLRFILKSLEQREARLKANLISARGSSDYSDTPEVLELMRIVPTAVGDRHNALALVKKFYLLQSNEQCSLEKLKECVLSMAELFYNQLQKQASSRALAAFNEYYGSNQSDDFKDFESTDVDEAITILASKGDGVKHKTGRILTLAVKYVKCDCRELFELIEDVSDEELFEILNVAYNSERTFNSERTLDRSKILEMCSELIKQLQNTLKIKRLSPIHQSLAEMTENSVAGLNRRDLIESVKALVAVTAHCFKLNERDVSLMHGGLDLFTDQEASTYQLSELRSSFAKVVTAGDAGDSEALIKAIKNVFVMVSRARFQKQFENLKGAILRADDKHTVSLVIKNVNNAEEICRVKTLAAELLQIDECAYMKARVQEMTTEFVDHLPEHAQAEVNYVSDHKDSINKSFSDFHSLLEAEKNQDYSINLAGFKEGRFEFLRKGLGKKRLASLLTRLDALISTEEDSDVTASSYKNYLESIRAYLNSQAGLNVVVEAAKQFRDNYVQPLFIVLEQMKAMTEEDFKVINLELFLSNLDDIRQQLTKHDKSVLLGLIAENTNPTCDDLFSVVEACINGNEFENAPTISDRPSILGRYKNYTTCMQALPLQPMIGDYAPMPESLVTEMVEDAADMETAEVVDAMRENIHTKLQAIVDLEQMNYHTAFRTLAKHFGDEAMRSKMWSASFDSLIEVLDQTVIALYENQASFEMQFLDADQIADLQSSINYFRDISSEASRLNLDGMKKRLAIKLDVILEAIGQDLTTMEKLASYAKPLISAVGTEEQQQKLEARELLVKYKEVSKGTRSPYQLQALQVSLFVSMDEQLKPFFHAAHDDLSTEAEAESVLNAAKSLASRLEVNSETFTNFNLASVIPGLLKKLFDLKNPKLRCKTTNECSAIIESIRVLYLFCQINGNVLGTSEIPNLVDSLVDNFANAFINLRNNHSDVMWQSIPCSSLYASSIIQVFSTDEQKLEVIAAKANFEQAREDAMPIFNKAAAWIDNLKNVRGLPSGQPFPRKTLSNALKILTFEDNNPAAVKTFIHHFNRMLGCNKITGELKLFEDNLTIENLRSKLFNLFETFNQSRSQSAQDQVSPAATSSTSPSDSLSTGDYSVRYG